MGIIKYKFLEKKTIWPFVVWGAVAVVGIVAYIILFSQGIAIHNDPAASASWQTFIVFACIFGFIGLISLVLLIDAIIQYRLSIFKKQKIIKEAGLDKKE